MKKYYLAAFAILGLISCNVEVAQPDVPTIEEPQGPQKVQMTFGSTVTKSYFGAAGENGYPVYWSGGESIGVYDGTEVEKFTVGTGYAGQKIAAITGLAFSGASAYYAKYPYLTTDSVNGTVYTTNLPTNQTAVEGTYDPAAIIAVDSAEENGELYFNNAVAFLKFKLGNLYWIADRDVKVTFNGKEYTIKTGDTVTEELTGAITSITFSNSSAFLSGPMTVDAASTAPVVTPVGNKGSKSVALSGTFETGKEYFFVVAPGSLTDVTFSIETASGITFQRTLTGTKTVAADKVVNMGVLNLSKTDIIGASLNFDGFSVPGTYFFSDGTNSTTSEVKDDSSNLEECRINMWVGEDKVNSADTYEDLPVSGLIILPVFLHASNDPADGYLAPYFTDVTYSRQDATVSAATIEYRDQNGNVVSALNPVFHRATVSNGTCTNSAYVTWTDQEGWYPMRAVVAFYGRAKHQGNGCQACSYLVFNSQGLLEKTVFVDNYSYLNAEYLYDENDYDTETDPLGSHESAKIQYYQNNQHATWFTSVYAVSN